MKSYYFSVSISRGFNVGLGLAITITGWNIPDLHNLTETKGQLIVKTKFHEADWIAQTVARRTKGGVTLTLLKQE